MTFSSPKTVTVSPLFDDDEGFHETRATATRYSSDSLLAYPNLAVSSPNQLSFSTPDIQNIFTVEMDKSEFFLKAMDGPEKLFNITEHLGRKKKSFSITHSDSFFSSIRPLLCIFQIFGVMPVTGLLKPNHEELKFKWKHWKIFYSSFILTGLIVLFIFCLIVCFRHGFSYDRSAPLVFYSSACIGIVLFFDLARQWETLNKQFNQADYMLADYGYPKNQGRRFLILTVVFSCCALVEHLLSKLVSIMRTINCKDGPTYRFFLDQYYPVFSMIDYNIFMGIFAIFFNFSATALWNLTDLFLGLMGMSLSARIFQLNQALAAVHGKEKPSPYWRKVREEYNSLSILTKQVDQRIQRIMLLSLGDNLFFICLQLLKSLRKQSNIYQNIYFFWSFGFLILRTCFVTLSAAGVYDQSRESKTVLYSVPHESFCLEVRRFLTQLTTDELVLTGCRFFSVTRGLVLTIAGTVVTYEIVLVQFKIDTGEDNWGTNMTICAPPFI